MKAIRELFRSPGKFALTFVWLYYPFAWLFASGAMTTTGYTPWRDFPEVLPIYLISFLVLYGQVRLLRNRAKETTRCRAFCIAAAVLVLLVLFGLVLGPIAYIIALIVYALECPRIKTQEKEPRPTNR